MIRIIFLLLISVSSYGQFLKMNGSVQVSRGGEFYFIQETTVRWGEDQDKNLVFDFGGIHVSLREFNKTSIDDLLVYKEDDTISTYKDNESEDIYIVRAISGDRGYLIFINNYTKRDTSYMIMFPPRS